MSLLKRSDLHPYQNNIITLAKTMPNIGLFLDMGMGKSATILTILADSPKGKTLIVAPLSVARNVWAQEIQKWDHCKHFKVSKILGSEKERLAALNEKANIYIINNENLKWLQNQKPQFDYLVIDESSRFKDPSTQRFKALKKMLSMFKRRIIATGTPTPQSLQNIWSQIGILDLGSRLGTSITKFRETYMMPDQRNRHTNVIYSWRLKDGAEQVINDKIKDICFSMKADDYLQLPEMSIINHKLDMDTKVRKAYDTFKKDMVIDIQNATITAVTAAVLINKLLQFTSGVLYKEGGTWERIHDTKLEYLEDLLDDGTPSLIFYHFKSSLEALQKRFPDAEILSDQSIKNWQEGRLKHILVHPQSGGVGINLQNNYWHTTNVVWFDLPWSSEGYQQGIKRVHRQGQTKPVVVHRLIMKDSVDEQVIKSLEGKINVQEIILEALKYISK